MAGESPNIRSHTVHLYGSGQPEQDVHNMRMHIQIQQENMRDAHITQEMHIKHWDVHWMPIMVGQLVCLATKVRMRESLCLIKWLGPQTEQPWCQHAYTKQTV